MNVSGWLDWLKLSPRYLVPVALVATALLFLPSRLLSTIGLSDFAGKYKMWIGVVFLAANALLLTHFSYWVGQKISGARKNKQFLKVAKDGLADLTPEEKLVLSDYILLQTKTRNLDVRSGVTCGLEQAMVIYRASNLGRLHDGFAYNLQPWAWEELNAHPELLEPVLSQRRAELERGPADW